MTEIKNKNRIKWIISVFLIIAILTGMLGMLGGCGNSSEEESTAQAEAGEMEIEMSKTESPVKLTAKQVISADEGISAQADNTYHLTATVEPLEAVNQAIDFIAEWENSESDWAIEKNVSDYIEILQEADGSPEADIRCIKAFGEPIIVSAVIRGNEALRDSCKLDYVRRFVGMDYSITAAWGGKTYAQWDLKPGTNTVDFIQLDSSYKQDDWTYGWGNKRKASAFSPFTGNTFQYTTKDYYSDTYTKNFTVSPTCAVSVAATSYYLKSFSAVLSLNYIKVQAEEYVHVSNNAFSEFILNSFVGPQYFDSYSQYSAFRTQLYNNSNGGRNVMLRIKVARSGGTETIYNIRFNISSLSTASAQTTGESTSTPEEF